MKKLKRKFETAPLADVLKKVERSEDNKPVVEKVGTKREPYTVVPKPSVVNR